MSKSKLPPAVVIRREQLVSTAKRTCGLLREYARKLHHISDRLHDFGRQRYDHAGGGYGWVQDDEAVRQATVLIRRFTILASSAEQLARTASGLIEGAALPLTLKYELLLRSREFENALVETREAAALVQRGAMTGHPLDPSLLREMPIPDLAARHRELDKIVPQPVG